MPVAGDLTPTRHTHPMALVCADALQTAGVNIDAVATDRGHAATAPQQPQAARRGKLERVPHLPARHNNFGPASHLGLRGNGDQAWFGLPRAPRREALGASWLEAPDLAAQQAVCAELQRALFQHPTYIPLGAYCDSTADRWRRACTGLPHSPAMRVRRFSLANVSHDKSPSTLGWPFSPPLR